MANSVRKRFEEKFQIDPASNCHVWCAATNNSGYGHFGVNGKVVDAHRFSYEEYVGTIPHGMFVLHRCDNQSCVNPEHLFLGTQNDNLKDMDKKGRRAPVPSGELSWASKLTKKQVNGIRADSRSHRFLASVYGVGKTTIGSIKSNKTWRTA